MKIHSTNLVDSECMIIKDALIEYYHMLKPGNGSFTEYGKNRINQVKALKDYFKDLAQR